MKTIWFFILSIVSYSCPNKCDGASRHLKEVAHKRGTTHVGMCNETDSETKADCSMLLRCLEEKGYKLEK